MASEIDRIVRMVEKTFDRQPWYGPSVMSILSEIKPDEGIKRMGDAHSIIELVLHMTSWRKFVARRLIGDNEFQIDDDSNFPKSGTWTDAMTGLEQSQQVLVKAIKSFPEERLGELVPSSSHKYTYYTLVHGIIQHDVYHLGQIAYIRKALS